jgi:oligopeptide/dipeptide ABC transporter ATP-binding protein
MGAFDPVYRVGDQIVEAVRAHRESGRRAAWHRAEEVLEQVELAPSTARRYPHELSGGMRQRAAIAMALVLDPKLVIADEPTTALDVITQAGILGLLKRLQKERNLSILLISHDLSVLAQTCDRIMVMYAGVIVETADAEALFDTPQHPYTRALLRSFPDVRQTRKSFAGLPGSPPDLLAPPRGCRFHPRCPKGTDACVAEEPVMTNVGADHSVRCLLLQ